MLAAGHHNLIELEGIAGEVPHMVVLQKAVDYGTEAVGNLAAEVDNLVAEADILAVLEGILVAAGDIERSLAAVEDSLAEQEGSLAVGERNPTVEERSLAVEERNLAEEHCRAVAGDNQGSHLEAVDMTLCSRTPPPFSAYALSS